MASIGNRAMWAEMKVVEKEEKKFSWKVLMVSKKVEQKVTQMVTGMATKMVTERGKALVFA